MPVFKPEVSIHPPPAAVGTATEAAPFRAREGSGGDRGWLPRGSPHRRDRRQAAAPADAEPAPGQGQTRDGRGEPTSRADPRNRPGRRRSAPERGARPRSPGSAERGAHGAKERVPGRSPGGWRTRATSPEAASGRSDETLPARAPSRAG